MGDTRKWVRAAVAAGALALAGCSLLSEPWHRHSCPRPAGTGAAAEPVLPLPVGHQFELHGDDTVLGVVQLTTVGKKTCPPTSRGASTSAAGIVRANPGVDPWIPGVGRKVVVPTQFILPNAPHEGVVINLAAMRI